MKLFKKFVELIEKAEGIFTGHKDGENKLNYVIDQLLKLEFLKRKHKFIIKIIVNILITAYNVTKEYENK